MGKATIYRRWSGKEELFVDVMRAVEPPDPELPGTSMRDDLLTLLESLRQRGLYGPSYGPAVDSNPTFRNRSSTRYWKGCGPAICDDASVTAHLPAHFPLPGRRVPRSRNVSVLSQRPLPGPATGTRIAGFFVLVRVRPRKAAANGPVHPLGSKGLTVGKAGSEATAWRRRI